jgi:hypothetical protein
MRMQLSELKIDDSIYPRAGVSDFNVQRMISAMKAGATLPPIVIDAVGNRIVDGRHRYEAYLRQELKSIEIVQKSYASEGDLYADAVRLNISHGQALTPYNLRVAIIRLTKFGYAKDAISDVVRMPIERIEEIERGFASDAATGEPIALKGGLSHLAGEKLDRDQQETNRRYSGPKAVFFVRQLSALLKNDMAPLDSKLFRDEMDALCAAWEEARAESAA